MIQQTGSPKCQYPAMAVEPEGGIASASIKPGSSEDAATPEPCDVFSLTSGSPRQHPEKVKVLLVHGSHTGGHASAARAVEKALKQIPGVEVKNMNALDYASSGAKKGQIAIFNAITDYLSPVRTWAFQKSFEGSPLVYWLGNTGMKLKSFFSKRFLNTIREEKPDIILSTHSPMNSLLSYWKEKGLIEQPVHSVVTDFSAHRMWSQKNIERYYVATEDVKKDLERFGVDENRIEVSGIPIDPAFNTPDSRTPSQVKAELGLDPDLPLVLMLGGSLGYGNFSEIAKDLDITPYPLQMAVITGKNEQKRKDLEALSQGLSKDLHVQGFVDTMKDWIKASDVVISKPGGLTTSELFAMKKPMVLINPVPGFEKILIPKITATGCAVLAEDEKDAADLAAKIATDPQLKENLDERLCHVGRPDSAITVAKELVSRTTAEDR